MKNAFIVLALAIFCMAPTSVLARKSVPIVNYENVAIATGSGNPATAEQVRQAITVGASSRGWNVVPQEDGSLQATITVRSKHTVVVQIPYAADRYSVFYVDSSNMNLEESDGQKLIHPFYNKWIDYMRESIRVELLKL